MRYAPIQAALPACRVVGPLEPGPYVLHASLAAFSSRHGSFGTLVGQSSSGAAGLLVEDTPTTEFYLVAARNDCGVGSRR